MKIEWKKEYLLNEESIDKEHKELFAIVGDAFVIVDPSKKKEKVKNTLKKFLAYTKTHFENEENFMQSIEYPKLQEHQQLHRQNIIKISELLKKLPTTNISAFERELATFLNTFANFHILKEDKKIKEWLDNNSSIAQKQILQNQKYLIGDKIIDEQNKTIFDLLQTIQEQKKLDISSHLNTLSTYKDKYLKTEEKFLKKISFCELEEHLASHELLCKKIDSFIQNHSTFDEKRVKRELITLIKSDIFEHIAKEDKKISNWLSDLKQMQLIS